MKKILVTLIAFVSLSAFASDDWFTLSTSHDKNYKVEGQKGSFYEGETTGSLIIRGTIKGKNPKFNIVFMAKKDCQAGFGNVYYYSTDQTLENKFPYVYNGGTNAQNVADMICALLAKPTT